MSVNTLPCRCPHFTSTILELCKGSGSYSSPGYFPRCSALIGNTANIDIANVLCCFFPFNATHIYSLIPQLTCRGLQGQRGCLYRRALESGHKRIRRHVSLSVNNEKKKNNKKNPIPDHFCPDDNTLERRAQANQAFYSEGYMMCICVHV